MKPLKSLLLAICLVLEFSTVAAQKQHGISEQERLWKSYAAAKSFGDLDAAKSFLFSLVTLGADRVQVYDSLAHIYFSLGAYRAAIQACDSIPLTRDLREVRAYAFRALGDARSALPDFEALYQESGKPVDGYQVASIQYALKRFGECEQTTRKVLTHPDAATEEVLITSDDGGAAKVSYLAASHNLLGALYMEWGQKEKARDEFRLALDAAPDFGLAQNNLAQLENGNTAR